MIGPHASDEEIERMRGVISAHPERWIAQDVVKLSTVPDGRRGRRHVPRATSTCGPSPCSASAIDIVPGGLTRVALERAR